MKRILLPLIFLISLLPFSQPAPLPNGSPLPTPFPENRTLADETAEVEQAIQEALSTHGDYLLGALLFKTEIDNVTVSPDSEWATAWLVPQDPDTGEAVPAEPGLTVAKKQYGDWQVILPNDPGWSTAVQEIPDDVLPPEDKQHWLEMYSDQRLSLQVGTLNGYLLPFAAGTRLVLTRSITHNNPPDPDGNMHYSFDFAAYRDASGKSPMFPIYASKAGTVKYARWIQENGSESSPGNYLVLEDTTTSPVTYQLYLHLAKDSIPPALRTTGTPVLQGQYIGLADDTGASTGNHLHFQVQVPIYANSYWGKSVDITFSDVSINGGRPRTIGEARYYPQYGSQGQTEYVSANTVRLGPTPPKGDILEPLKGSTISSGTLKLKGWGTDDDATLASAQFLALYNGAWHEAGPPLSGSPFETDWDLCADGVPDGPVSLALRLSDTAGSQTVDLPGLRHLSKNYACPPPPPACVPDENQAALYAGPDFQGACKVFDIGNTTTPAAFGSLGDNGAVSLQLGTNVQATLSMDSNNRGRSQTFTAGPGELLIDSNLADDWIGANTVSSVRIQKRDETVPATPVLLSPASSSTFPYESSISLAWEDTGGAREYQVKINNSLMDWQATPYRSLGSLSPGTYSWQVKARNGKGESGWSTARTLTVSSPSASAKPQANAPFNDLMETDTSGWTASGGWRLTADDRHSLQKSWRYSQDGASYSTGSPNSGDLTSPSIAIPAVGSYFLNFWYLYETEGPGVYWDQRWVQISTDGGPFTNLVQLSDDQPNLWLQSPAIDLSSYAGHSVQIRFNFNTLDASLNSYKGWYIDDVSVTEAPPMACSESDAADDSYPQAQPILYNQEMSEVVCRRGDVDFYQFSGEAGDRIGVFVKPYGTGSPLNPFISLFDSDGTSLLASARKPDGGPPNGAYLTYRLQRSGVYYLKVQAWEHPSVGGSDVSYSLRLFGEKNGSIDQPTAAFAFPQGGRLLPNEELTLTIAGQDPTSGISHVEFLWHSADWQAGDWALLGEDWNGEDGWSFPFHLKDIAAQNGFAFYAKVYDWTGTWIGTGVWDLGKGASINYFPFLYR